VFEAIAGDKPGLITSARILGSSRYTCIGQHEVTAQIRVIPSTRYLLRYRYLTVTPLTSEVHTRVKVNTCIPDVT